MKLDAQYVRSALRSGFLRLTARGRRRLALEHGALYSRTRKPGLTNLDYEGTVYSDGLDIYTCYAGPKTPELTVVFIHGFTLASDVYYMQVDFLREKFPNVKSLLIDARGHGRTGRVDPELCTIEGTADDVLAAINAHATTGPIILVGHSLGGLTALNLVKRVTEEAVSRIRGVILVATSIESLSAQGVPQVLASPAAEAVKNTVEASPDDARRFREYAAELIAPTLAVGVFRRPTNSHVIELHAAMINETPLDTFVGLFGDLQEHDELDAAEAVRKLPGYVISGEKDYVTPKSQADRIHELWPKSYYQVAEGAGHMIPLEAPGVLNNAIAELIDEVLDR